MEKRVDHIGFRTVSEEEYLLITATLTALLGEGEETPAEGHQRTFFRLGEKIRLEVQLWDMPEKRKPAFHLDEEAEYPMELLESLGEGAQDWGEGETPRGGIAISPNFMVMAREAKK